VLTVTSTAGGRLAGKYRADARRITHASYEPRLVTLTGTFDAVARDRDGRAAAERGGA
jgi:hypothetical protein